ncbi:AAA family ATPase [Cellulomonas sp. PhB143]|uniref:AAA family ATPase n=1 Tax=Cellulomonas sp. PhB143 TaxID=2485186 RepID=UPI000F4AE5C3|nr:AAA family ATPase [Cellulomonas sp. PhB143]ROS73373.1 exonuclease SbcC [Cellulomonas sp. PhB143]
MYLHSLTLQAIGPFPGRHRIDFAELGASGIFLLEGPTGAGKSTLIDAIVFALYGTVASESSSSKRLRSAHAGPEEESFVDLVFETGSGVYRVRRTPEYQRPKKRGSGTTTQQAGVRLWRLSAVPEPGVDDAATADALDGLGDLLSARLDEAGGEIERAVGLDRRQFVQTVVLPQGEFASFLRADPEARRGLLQRVFGTEVYERVQAQLAEMSRAARGAVTDARGGVRRAAEQLVGAAGLPPEQGQAVRDAAGSDAEAEPDGLTQLADEHVSALRAEADGLEADELDANAVLLTARERLDAERAVLGAIERRAALVAERAELAARAGDVDAGRARLRDAARAAVVEPVERRARRARGELAAATERRGLARVGLPESVVCAGESELLTVRSAVADAAARLAALRPVGARIPGREAELADARKEVERLAAEHGLLGGEVEARPGLRAALLARRDASAQEAAALGVRQEQVLRARAVLKAAQGVEATEAGLVSARAARSDAVARAGAAVDAERTARRARIAGMAGEIAATLEDGSPCAVCGSPEHPAPADPTGSVTVEDVEGAERSRVAAEASLATAGSAVEVLEERLDALRRTAEGHGAVDAEERLDAAELAVRLATDAVEAHVAAERELEDFDEDSVRLTERVGELATTLAAERSRVEALDRALAQDRGQVAGEVAAAVRILDDVSEERHREESGREESPRGDVGPGRTGAGSPANPVTVVEDALRERSRSLDELAAATVAVAAAERSCAQCAEDVERVLADTGFAEVAHAMDAVVPEEDHAALERTVRTHDAAVARVESGLAEPVIAALAQDAGADVDAARAVVAEAESVARTVARRLEGVRVRLAGAAASAAAIRDAIGAWEAARLAAAPVSRMAALAAGTSGDNAHALTLATFVLVRRFEEVVAAANGRLAEMSDGRYELVRSDTREDVRTRRTGLAMRVVDHVTEQSRDPRTLSGGETFYVSLCLALGMADVVTAEAGGVDLGTLFVDEGFGSLDPQTLEAVLAELGRLRDGGRVIGVVSHVDALKQSIAERIEVRRLPSGASTLHVRA